MFLIYDRDTKIVIAKNYRTEHGAKIASGRMMNSNKFLHSNLAVSDMKTFYTSIEPMVERTNMMTGKTYMEPLNTPIYLSPSSETYWSS